MTSYKHSHLSGKDEDLLRKVLDGKSAPTTELVKALALALDDSRVLLLEDSISALNETRPVVEKLTISVRAVTETLDEMDARLEEMEVHLEKMKDLMIEAVANL